MMTLAKILITLLIVAAGWALAHRGLPFVVTRVGRLLGFKMRLTPLTERRVLRFRRIRRGYWCFVVITTAFVTSLFLELFMNHKALYVRRGNTSRCRPWRSGRTPGSRFSSSTR